MGTDIIKKLKPTVKSIIVLTATLVVILLLGFVSFFFSHNAYHHEVFVDYDNTTNLYPYNVIGMIGYEEVPGGLIAVGEDPQITITPPDHAFEAIRVVFKNPLYGRRVQVYFAENHEPLSEENSVSAYFRDGDTEILIYIPEGTGAVFTSLRVDIDIFDQTFELSGIYAVSFHTVTTWVGNNDWWLLTAVLCLVAIGLWFVYIIRRSPEGSFEKFKKLPVALWVFIAVIAVLLAYCHSIFTIRWDALFSVFIASLIITVLAITYAVLLNRKVMETYALSVISIIVVIYCFGLLNFRGSLLWGIYAVSALAVAGCVFLVYKWRDNKSLPIKIEAWQGIIFFLGALLFSTYLHYGRFFWSWDDFPHWGLTVKHMYHFGAFRTFSNENVIAAYSNSYPPGSGIFGYFFTVFSANFAEFNTLIANTLLYFTLSMPFAKRIFIRKHAVKSVAILIAFAVIPLLGHQLYTKPLVDDLLGLIFGLAILYYLVYRFDDKFGVLMVTGAVVLLFLIKDVGLLLAIGVIILIAADLLIFNRKNLKMLLIPVGSLAFTAISWNILLNVTGTADTTLNIPRLSDVIALITGNSEAYHYEIAADLGNEIVFGSVNPFPISLLVFCVLFLIVAMFLAYLLGINLKRTAILSFGMVVGMALYLFFLLLLACFIFGKWEGIRIAEWWDSRYALTFLFGMIVFLLYFLVSEEAVAPRGKLKTSMLGVICASLILSLSAFTAVNAHNQVFFPRSGNVADTFNERPTSAARKWIPYLEDEEVYIISQGCTGFGAIQIGFELYPYVRGSSSNWDWSIGLEPYFYDDPWTRILTPDEWREHILNIGYTVLYMHHYDGLFVETYGHFFRDDISSHTPYRIIFTDGEMELVKLTHTG